jgi:hypothetical protein
VLFLAVQTSFGRTFAGDAFIADPPELLFKDFVPGQVYRASLQLINRGFTKNSIRLLEVPAEVGQAELACWNCCMQVCCCVHVCQMLICVVHYHWLYPAQHSPAGGAC